MDPKQLCYELIKSESESEVQNVLKKYELFDDDRFWKPLGGRENNWGTVGNQSDDPLGALVELLINSSDAILMRKCKEQGVEPEDRENAPKSINDALKRYYNLDPESLGDMPERKRTELAEDSIGIVVTGERRGKKPCFAIYDKGEGQPPKMFEDTFLSIGASNKISTHFVQGKYCQGSHGVIGYCGANKSGFKLIVSKSFEDEDRPLGKWGFTIFRIRPPKEHERSRVAEYLLLDGKIPSFQSSGLKVIPREEGNAHNGELLSGTYIKLYEYQITQSSIATLDFNFCLGSYLTSPALPIRIFETRNFSGHTMQTTFMGLTERLKSARNEANVEPGFPISGVLNTKYGVITYSTYVLTRKAEMKRFAQDNGIILTINGQRHAFHPRSWFGSKKVELSSLRDSIICLLDCSQISQKNHDDLFKASRDRMENNAKTLILDELAEQLKNNQKIRELKNRRRQEVISDKIADNKISDELIKEIMRDNPSFQNFLKSKGRISAPFPAHAKGGEDFEGKKHPTYFRLKKEFPSDSPKIAHPKTKNRIQFETDVADDYLNRSNYPGRFELSSGDGSQLSWSLDCHSGNWTLKLELPNSVKAGEKIELNYSLDDDTLVTPFTGSFHLEHQPKQEKLKPPVVPNEREKNKNDAPQLNDNSLGATIKPPREVKSEDWEKYGMDKMSAIIAKHHEGDEWDFFYNSNNVHLEDYMKHKQRDPEILKQQFSLALQFLALGFIADNKDGDPENLSETIEKFTRGAAVAILAVIEGLSGIED